MRPTVELAVSEFQRIMSLSISPCVSVSVCLSLSLSLSVGHIYIIYIGWSCFVIGRRWAVLIGSLYPLIRRFRRRRNSRWLPHHALISLSTASATCRSLVCLSFLVRLIFWSVLKLRERSLSCDRIFAVELLYRESIFRYVSVFCHRFVHSGTPLDLHITMRYRDY